MYRSKSLRSAMSRAACSLSRTGCCVGDQFGLAALGQSSHSLNLTIQLIQRVDSLFDVLTQGDHAGVLNSLFSVAGISERHSHKCQTHVCSNPWVRGRGISSDPLDGMGGGW